jgi:hypothetical protein
MTENKVSEVRTPYDKRDCLQEQLHRGYGKEIMLMDIDSMCDSEAGLKIFMEYDRSGSIAFADFKNESEQIQLWKLKPMIGAATKLGIPAYISVLYREIVIAYCIIPLNDICRAIPGLSKPRFMSEATYVKFLHFIRKTNPSKDFLETFSGVLPPNLKQPNIID